MLALYYKYIYLLLLGIILVLSNQDYIGVDWSEKRARSKNAVAFILLLFLIGFIGFRPVHDAFADMVGYNSYYRSIMGDVFEFNPKDENIIFDNLFRLCASINIAPSFFFTIIAIIYFGCLYLACKKLFPDDLLQSFLVCLTAFSTFSYATNGIKAGAAASVFLLAVANRDKFGRAFLLALISIGFHHSMVVVMMAFILSVSIRKTRLYFLLWAICLVIAALHIDYFQSFMAGFVDEKGASYLLTDSDSFVSGFRLDFIVYSSAPVFIGYWLIIRKNLKDTIYEFILRLYLLTNSIWMLCMYASFTNRIAYLSWFMYPVVLIYPFLSVNIGENQGNSIRVVSLLHYAFTLFMDVVYYAF